MERTYHQEDAEQGPMVLERLSDLKEARELLGDFTDIRGMEVVNPTGDVVGMVDELYVDPKQEAIVMAGLNFGAKRVLVPIDQLEMVDDQISVMTTPEIVEAAPEFEEGMNVMAFHDYWCQAAASEPAAQPARSQAITVVDVEEEG